MMESNTFFYLFLCVFVVAAAEEACNSYAGGQVYPGEGRVIGGHALHSSKAQSKFQCYVKLATFEISF